jgi:hypothetical protein
MAVSVKITVFWDVSLDSLVNSICVSEVLTDTIIRMGNTLMREVVTTPETSVNFYQTTWHNCPEDSHPHKHISFLCDHLRRDYNVQIKKYR